VPDGSQDACGVVLDLDTGCKLTGCKLGRSEEAALAAEKATASNAAKDAALHEPVMQAI
jgi:hypothetical protein